MLKEKSMLKQLIIWVSLSVAKNTYNHNYLSIKYNYNCKRRNEHKYKHANVVSDHI